MENYVPYWALREHIPGATPINYEKDYREKCCLSSDAKEYIKSNIISEDKAKILSSISVNKREALLGWQILVLGGEEDKSIIGLAVITSVRKKHGSHTEYCLSTEMEDFWVRLKRGFSCKGVPFRPLRRVTRTGHGEHSAGESGEACQFFVTGSPSSPSSTSSSLSSGSTVHLHHHASSRRQDRDKEARAEMLRTLNHCYQYYNATVPIVKRANGDADVETVDANTNGEDEAYDIRVEVQGSCETSSEDVIGLSTSSTGSDSINGTTTTTTATGTSDIDTLTSSSRLARKASASRSRMRRQPCAKKMRHIRWFDQDSVSTSSSADNRSNGSSSDINSSSGSGGDINSNSSGTVTADTESIERTVGEDRGNIL
eukprot:CAMPEP_0174959390 /NCGR_PEP_ID=MMETSP0004_2-20121128/3149_1 /TAXON_ID=420556 /ORGANISM="Ochromonas sp., Strain CCMP1393" /LENGTH=371 /DNA_ID=CAMNT_0016207701 /DNA_START=159 /DNA_END=1274 /DNA_ORIENTATION=+